MSGEKNLATLLESLEPNLLPETYVFHSSNDLSLQCAAALNPIALFQESEGLSLVLTKAAAEQLGINILGIFKCITLSVHSSLEAVGLTAAVAEKLSQHDISANVVAAFYHDHIFVPESKAELALELLREFKGKAS
ncbi:MAG: ACT domain-containing protein [Pseudohongiellaceae bacterium]